MFRDIVENPYTPDEQRVAEYIDTLTCGAIGAGDDPIGFLLASHNMLTMISRKALTPGLLDAMFEDLIEADSVPPTASPETRKP